MSIFIILGVASLALGIYEICKERIKWYRFRKQLRAARFRTNFKLEYS